MTENARPVVVAYDGSPAAQEAVRIAAELFTGRRLLVVSVWEAGLAYLATPPTPDPVAYPTFKDAEAVDEVEHDMAAGVAGDGTALARGLGADAEAVPVRDVADIAETIAAVADEHDAAAVVVGTRGRGRVASRLFGSTSRGLLNDSRRPLMVVHAPHEE